MRFILAKANFSGEGNNIGTLNSWFVSYNKPNGITWSSIQSNVDKNATFTAMATLDSTNYEIQNVTVSMGDVSQSGAGSNGGISIEISENNIVIGIVSVTSNVNISVITKSKSSSPELPEEPGTPTNYTFTITPTPISATVTLSATGYSTVTGTGSKSITVANGTTVSWNVSASGYITKTNTHTINNSDYNLTVTLDEEAATTATLTVNPTPSDARVTLYAKGYSQSGNSMTVPNNGTVNPTYQVYKDNYLSQGGMVPSIKSSQTLDITLQPFSAGNWTDISSTAEKVADYFVVDGGGKFNGPYSFWCHWILPATPGKKYRITATAGQSARLWGFYTDKPVSDGSVKPISVSPNNGMTVKIADEVVAPEGTVYLVVNNRIGSSDTKAIIEVLN